MGSEEVPVLELRIHTEVVNLVSLEPQLVACLVEHRIHTQVIVLTFAKVVVRIHTQVTGLASAVAVRILTSAVATRNLAQATHQAKAFHIQPCHQGAYHLEALQLVVNLRQLK